MLVLKYFCEVNTKQIFFPNVAFCVLLCLLNAVQLGGKLHLGELALVLLRRDVSTDLSGALDTIAGQDPLCRYLLRVEPGLDVRIVKSLPRIIVETSFMYFLHHLGSQDRGEFVCNPRRQLSSWVGVSHVAKVAALTSQRSDEESCQVGHAPHKTSLRRVLSVKDTVVDDVILLWCLYPRSLEDKVPVLQRRRTVEGVVGDVIVGVERSKFSRADHVLVPALSIDRVMEDVVQSISRYISEGCLQSDHSEAGVICLTGPDLGRS